MLERVRPDLVAGFTAHDRLGHSWPVACEPPAGSPESLKLSRTRVHPGLLPFSLVLLASTRLIISKARPRSLRFVFAAPPQRVPCSFLCIEVGSCLHDALCRKDSRLHLVPSSDGALARARAYSSSSVFLHARVPARTVEPRGTWSSYQG